MPLASTLADRPLPADRFAPIAVRQAPPQAEPVRRGALPAIEPGQLWLAELDPDRGLSVAERHLLGSANVILYDRALAAEVVATLPLGGYAEPAPPPAGLPDSAVIQRCVRFALDGWSVVRLIDARLTKPRRAARLSAVSERLREGGAARSLPVRILEDAGNCAYTATHSRLGDLDREVVGGERLIVVFDAVTGGGRPPSPVAANGLAG